MQRLTGIGLWLALLAGTIHAADVEWPVNGGPYNIRYSPLTQINRANVGQLKVAWSYDSHDAFKDSEMQSNPIVVDGVLYATTPKLRVVALDAATAASSGRSTPRAARRRSAATGIAA